MSNAALLAFVFAFLFLTDAALLLTRPQAIRQWLLAFPRQKIPAALFTGIALIWFARNLWSVDFGGFSVLKYLLFPLVPLLWFGILTCLPDLLAVRSLCAVLLLAGNPLIIWTRWQPTPASPLVGVLIYLMILKCMLLIVYPHFWKRATHWLFADDRRRTAAAYAEGTLGIAVLAVAWISR